MTPSQLPEWPRATVAILVTAGARPHAIPVSALLRAGPQRMLVGLARTRETLARLRAHPEVTVSVIAADLAFSADGQARVIEEHATERVAAVEIEIESIHDHRRPTFTIVSGPSWHWTDPQAQQGDDEVHAALTRLARTRSAQSLP